METIEKVMATLKSSGEPLSAGQIAEKAGLEKKDVEKAMNKLKVDGKIVSPKRCYWQPA